MVSLYRAAYQSQPRALSYSGVSTVEKPINIENGSWFIEIDTGDIYRYDGQYNIWHVQPKNGGGQIVPVIEELNVTTNGTYEAPEGVNGYSPVIVNVSGGEPDPPDDGKTRLYITIPPNAVEGLPPLRADIPLYIKQTVANGVTIDWGDGSEPETLDGTGNVNTTHTYENAGDYVITLDPSAGCELGFGADDAYHCVLGETYDNNLVYCNRLRRVVIGNKGVTSIGSYAFSSCNSLASIVIPDNVISIENGAFSECYSLASIVIPDGVTSIASYTFNYCHSLASIVIPDNVTSIPTYAFSECYSLASIVIPDGVTSIENYAFNICYGVKEYHLLPPTPPLLPNKYAFYKIPSDCIIYVPKGSLEAYQTATNWSTYADQIQEEPA